MFGALQTQYFGLLLRRAAWILAFLTGLPAVALGAYVAAEHVLTRSQAGDAGSSSEEEEQEQVLPGERDEGATSIRGGQRISGGQRVTYPPNRA